MEDAHKLLKKARKYYPKGTRYNNLNVIDWSSGRDKVSDGKPVCDRGNTVRLNINEGNMTIYENGVWAHVIGPNGELTDPSTNDISMTYEIY